MPIAPLSTYNGGPIDPNQIYTNRPENVPAGYRVITLDDGTYVIAPAPPPDYRDTLDPPPGDAPMPLSLGITSDDVLARIEQLMQMYFVVAQKMREVARMTKSVELQAQVNELLAAADKQAAAGDLRMCAGIVQAAFQIGGGALQLGLSGAGGIKSLQGAKAQKEGYDFGQMAKEETDAGRANVYQNISVERPLIGAVLSEQGKNLQGMSQAFSNGVPSGIGGIVSAVVTNMAEQKDADAKRDSARAEMDSAKKDEADQLRQRTDEIISDVMSKLRDFEQTRQTTAHNLIAGTV